ncbi:MAG: LemA family protein [Nitriliruptoraceae bacterium]|nr:LemA family protein [Nitriliruptoraceae bacterium]
MLSTIGLVLLAVVVLYNQLVRARTHVHRAWAQVDTQLQRRHDLIPNLVETVTGYRDHERSLLDAVTAARAAALEVHDPVARQDAEDALGDALGRLLALDEAYPDLKADGAFTALQAELRATEDRLAFARGFANSRVARYRALIDTLPGVLLARPLGFPREALYALEDERARTRPAVEM